MPAKQATQAPRSAPKIALAVADVAALTGESPVPEWAIERADALTRLSGQRWVVVYRPRLARDPVTDGFWIYRQATLDRTPIGEPHEVIYAGEVAS